MSGATAARRERRRRWLWLAALCLYGLAALADFTAHLALVHDRLAPGKLALALSAGLFWPLDAAAQVLLRPST